MNIEQLVPQFVAQLQATSMLEAVAVVFGMISVVLANRNHVGLYPTGIVSTVIYIYLLAKPSVGLYAEAALNLYYLVMSIYGWVIWGKHEESEDPHAISVNNKRDWLVTMVIVVVGWLILYNTLRAVTNSDVPVWDAIVSATAWAGMWLLAKHKVENWVLLNISNAIAIPLFIHKGMPLTAMLTLFLFIVATFGYFRWRKLYKQQHAVA